MRGLQRVACCRVVADPLTEHLRRWLGEWPADGPGLHVVGTERRTEPDWDGRVSPLRGLSDGARTVVGVPPGTEEADIDRIFGGDNGNTVHALDSEMGVAGHDQRICGVGDGGVAVDHIAVLVALGELLDRPGAAFGDAVFRWSTAPAPLESLGTWVDARDPRLPEWLHPFNGGVLAVFDPRGAYLAGVGRKVHDEFGHEIAVGTTPAARGRGLARRLVVTAARRILAEGAVPTYLHDPTNHASARVAVSAGFPDRGWRLHGLWGGQPGCPLRLGGSARAARPASPARRVGGPACRQLGASARIVLLGHDAG